MEETVKQFEAYLKKNYLSPGTIKAYKTSINTYLNKYKEVTAENVIAFQHFLENAYSANTSNLRIIGFNRFLSFIGKTEYKLKLVKCRQASYLDNVITYSDYIQFKRKLYAKENKKWFFIIWVLASTGMRISELIQFSVENVWLGHIDVRAKGHKVRRVFIPYRLQKELRTWLKEQNITKGHIFRNSHNTPISIRGITKGLEREAVKAGINPHLVHPHAFRHLFAKKFLEKNGDIAMLADLLGHESLDTTKIYLKKTSLEQKEAIDEIVDW